MIFAFSISSPLFFVTHIWMYLYSSTSGNRANYVHHFANKLICCHCSVYPFCVFIVSSIDKDMYLQCETNKVHIQTGNMSLQLTTNKTFSAVLLLLLLLSCELNCCWYHFISRMSATAHIINRHARRQDSRGLSSSKWKVMLIISFFIYTLEKISSRDSVFGLWAS